MLWQQGPERMTDGFGYHGDLRRVSRQSSAGGLNPR